MTSAVRDLGTPTARRHPLQAPFANASVLVVTDDPTLVEATTVVLGDHGYTVGHVAAAQAGATLGAQDVDVVLLDAAGVDAPAAVASLRAVSPSTCIVAVLAPADLGRLADVLGNGATDFVVRPIEAVALRTLTTVNQAFTSARLARDNRRLQQRIAGAQPTDGLIGCSPLHRRMLGSIARAAESEATVLIEGKSGTGRSTVAEAIHRGSRRGHRTLVVRAAEGLVADALEQALREAQAGSLLLEDVERLPTDSQSRLVRFLKDRRENIRDGEARVLATTCARLPELVARGAFREDLFYRLNVLPVTVPTLAERRDDIPLLANHFLGGAAAQTGVAHRGFTPGAMAILESMTWPGNVSQLQMAIQRAHALAAGATIDREHLGVSDPAPQPAAARPARVTAGDDENVTEQEIKPFKDEEKRLLSRALRATGGNVRRAAQLLRIGRATLYRKIQSYKLRLF